VKVKTLSVAEAPYHSLKAIELFADLPINARMSASFSAACAVALLPTSVCICPRDIAPDAGNVI
jgi:hypothetical protein